MDVAQRLSELYCRHQDLLDEYRNLLALVARIKSGEVRADDVEILPGDAWRINVTVDAAKPVESRESEGD